MRLRKSNKNKTLCVYPNTKLNDEELLDQQNSSKQYIQTNKTRNCAVRLKRINTQIDKLKIPNKRNCVVRLKRLANDASYNNLRSSVKNNYENTKHKMELGITNQNYNEISFPDQKYSLQLGKNTISNITTRKQCSDNALHNIADKLSAGRLHLLEKIKKTKTLHIRDNVNEDKVTSNASNKNITECSSKEAMTQNSKPVENILSKDKTQNVIYNEKNLNKNNTKNSKSKTRQQKLRQTSGENIYEFLSQSQVSDLNEDPAADVIQKLINEGKVRVARKCRGRPAIKRNANKRNVKKVKQKNQSKLTKENKDDAADLYADNTANKNTDRYSPTQEDSLIVVQNPKTIMPTLVEKPKDDNSSSIFSNLARSVLLKQAGKTQQKRKLLEIAKKYVSTPNNKKDLSIHQSHISPISKPLVPTSNPLATSSPWRIREENNLPTLFSFNTTSSNLPSYSSFHIPSTPRKNKKKINNSSLNTDMIFSDNQSVEDANNIFNHTKLPLSVSSKSILSDESISTISFSPNDSNGENIPPIQNQENYSNNTDENVVIFNSRQLPNPRKALGHRSPLKAINILEVVTLPPWKNTNIMKPNRADITRDINKSKENSAESNDNSLFGFEDFINQENSNLDKEADRKKIEKALHNKTLYEKLHELKKWRPEQKEITHSNTNTQPIREVFEEYEERPKQRCIKEMLCSTFISSPQNKNPINKVNNIYKIGDKYTKMPSNKSFLSDDTNLFQELDPECTFDEKRPHRTYIRPYRKKRKVRNNLFMYIDSDESGEECKESSNERHSNEHETSIENGTDFKKKRKRNELKGNPALNSFIEDFNEMCNEVDQYALIVE